MTAPTGLPRLLAGFDADGGMMTLTAHERVHGALPSLAPGELIEVVAASGLRGRGGADFPAARKLKAVSDRRRVSAVVVNGSETEPASRKDRTLLARAPHLVLDGAQLAAEEVGTREVIVKLCEHESNVIEAVEHAIRERDPHEIDFKLSLAPGGYVTGEESAVMHYLNGGAAKPTFTPPRPYERGYRARPTLIHNPETLAQMALVARYGDHWYRELGTWEDPGSALVTISGAVTHPGVYELAFGTPMADLIAAAGGASEPLQALLVGGYFGTWVEASGAMSLRLAREDLTSVGCSLGAGVVIALGESSCGLHESARVIGYLADESAGQCGPCVYGLAAIADGFAALVEGSASAGSGKQLLRWCNDIRGRGACHHPNGAVRFVESSLRVFGGTIDAHRRGRCRALPAGLPLAVAHAAGAVPPVGAGAPRGWRR
jgi:NADH:ubiquinone oxidoreductase subunit F (NADH-binding)